MSRHGDASTAAALTTPGEHTLLPGQSPAGEYILSVLVKRTYTIVPDGVCQRAEADRPLLSGDVHWDHAMNSSVRYESDFIPFKVATDVVANGKAYAPGGAATQSCTASLRVADREKTIVVIGDRVAKFTGGATPIVTDPAPFTEMELRYERAYGGTDVYSDLRVPYHYPRNPLGLGFVVANRAASVDNLALPNLEDAEALLSAQDLCLGDYSNWETRPLPAGFGWLPKLWYPRALLAGVLPRDRAIEQQLRGVYARLVPEEHRDAYLKNGFRDMDFRFFSGASTGLTLPYLRGGEMVSTENLSRDGRLSFRLPTETPKVALDIGFGVTEPEVVLQTVMIHTEEGQVDLVWRGATPYQGPDWLPEMRTCDLTIS